MTCFFHLAPCFVVGSWPLLCFCLQSNRKQIHTVTRATQKGHSRQMFLFQTNNKFFGAHIWMTDWLYVLSFLNRHHQKNSQRGKWICLVSSKLTLNRVWMFVWMNEKHPLGEKNAVWKCYILKGDPFLYHTIVIATQNNYSDTPVPVQVFWPQDPYTAAKIFENDFPPQKDFLSWMEVHPPQDRGTSVLQACKCAWGRLSLKNYLSAKVFFSRNKTSKMGQRALIKNISEDWKTYVWGRGQHLCPLWEERCASHW